MQKYANLLTAASICASYCMKTKLQRTLF